MTNLAQRNAMRPLVLRSSTAAELMTRSPLSFEKHTPVHKASALLAFYELEAAPVVDEFDRPVGVVSKTHCAAWQEFCVRSSPDRTLCSDCHEGSDCDQATVTEIMQRAVAIVHERDSSQQVLDTLLCENRARVYVVGDDGELTGVVSISDVLRHLLASDPSRRVWRAGAALAR